MECPSGKILNGKTGRCVNINGAVGKKIIKRYEKFTFGKDLDEGDQYVVSFNNTYFGTNITVGVFKEHYVSGKKGMSLDDEEKPNYRFCDSDVCGIYCGQKSIPLKLVLYGFYSKEEDKPEPPRGYARKMLCDLLRRVIIEYPFVSIYDNIILEASGDVRGSFESLINLYKRMGFSIIGQSIKDGDWTDVCKEGAKMDDNKHYIGSILMGCKINDILEWCSNKGV